MEYTIIKNYRKNDALRASFNSLTYETFGFDFEEWYRNGYWNDKYIPYSIFFDGQIIANVSVNIMDFENRGSEEHYIQLGTVMTKTEYRNQGLIRALMTEIEKDYADVDGVFLFANDEVAGFYPKFGFKTAQEFQCVKTVDITNEITAEKADMNSKEDWDRVRNAIDMSAANSNFDLRNNSDLAMFYLSSFMRESVYFVKETEAYVVADVEGEKLLIHAIYSEKKVDIDTVISAFGKEVKRAKLGFTPLDSDGFDKVLLKEEDTTLFVKGKAFDSFTDEKKMFPLLAHA